MNIKTEEDLLFASEEAAADDAAWFERNLARNHRLRRPIGGERVVYANEDNPWVVVRQIQPGIRARLFLYLRAV